jgi:hypothetical protein
MRGLLRKYGYGREAGAEDASTPEGASAKPG